MKHLSFVNGKISGSMGSSDNVSRNAGVHSLVTCGHRPYFMHVWDARVRGSLKRYTMRFSFRTSKLHDYIMVCEYFMKNMWSFFYLKCLSVYRTIIKILRWNISYFVQKNLWISDKLLKMHHLTTSRVYKNCWNRSKFVVITANSCREALKNPVMSAVNQLKHATQFECTLWPEKCYRNSSPTLFV